MSTQPASTAEADHTIGNQLGLHVRAAAVVVRIANRFASTLTIQTPARSADARSVLDLLSLAATKGTKVKIVAEGPDATEAVAAVVALISQDFLE